MEVRQLRAKDVKALAKMLGKLKSGGISDILVALEKKESPAATGLALFRVIAADLTDDIYAWLADLIGVSVEDFDEMPVETPAAIIKELAKRGEFKDFFGSALQQAGGDSPSSTT